MSASVRDAVERLLAESDDEDLGDLDLSAITLEDILREEEQQQQQQSAGDAASFFSPATMTIATASGSSSGGGSGSAPAPASVPRGMDIVAKELSTEIAVGGNAALAAAHAHASAASAPTRSALEIAEAREKQLLSCVGVELVSPLQAKRRLRATARAKRQSSATATATQKHQPTPKTAAKKKKKTKLTLEAANGSAAAASSSSSSVVKVQAMDAISRQLQKNLEFKEHGPGSPTVVAIHSKFIAIGTSKGLVLIFDHFQNIRQVLGNTNDADSDGPVTAIDVSPGSDYLVCGYQSGRLVLWDMIKGTSLKAVSDAHEHPVVSLRFLKDQKPVLVSVDTNGVLNKINFSKMMGMVYVVDVDPIYDGSAGKLLSISILPQSAGNAKISHLTDQYVLAALSSEKVTFLIAIEPEVKVLYRWARPDDVGADDPVLPSLAFAWISFPGSSRALAPVLARGWGRHVQFLEVVFPGGQHHAHGKHGWPTFEEHDLQIETASDTTALQWLGDQVIVYLNAHDEICVYDVMSRQELEVVDVSLLELVFASYRGKSNARSFANSFRGCDNILYLLGLKELQTARVQPWTQRIDTLVDDGQWLEALALALDHYEGLKVAAADRAVRDRFPPVFFRDRNNDQCLVDLLHMSQTNQRTGEKEDVFRHEESAEEVRWRCGEELYAADVAQRLEETYQKARSGQVTKNFVPISVAERVADLLMEYVRLAIANAPTTAGAGRSHSKLDLSKSHYQMLAGVCIEYCAIIGRTDLLFGEIFKRFQDAGKTDVFVELLEPYILSDKLRTLSPDVLEAFVAHYDRHDKLAQVEQCLLHLQVLELDTETILSLCKKHELYSALVYIYNEAHQDFVTPLDILLDAMKNAQPPAPKPSPVIATRAPSGSKVSSLAAAFGGTTGSSTAAKPQETEEDPEATARRRRQYGYKLLLYLSYSLSGRSFPKHEPLAPQLLSKVRADVLHHLFDSSAPARLSALIELDAKAFLHILARTFDDPTVEFDGEKKALEALRPTSRYDSARKAGIAKCPSRLSMVLALANVVFGGLAGRSDLSQSAFGSVEHGHFFMFEARVLSGGAIDAQEYADALGATTPGGCDGVGSMMNSLMTFLALGPASLLRGDVATQHPATHEDGFDKAGRETMLVRLLQKLHKDSYDHAALLRSVTQEGMHRAAVILHKERGDVAQAVGAYLADTDHEFRMNAFTYIRVETDKVMDEDAATDAADGSLARRKIVEDALLTHAPALMETDDYAFVVLVLDKFPSLNNKVIQKFLSMGSKGGGAKLEFLYLKQILTAAGSGSSSSSGGGGASQAAAPLARRASAAGDVGDEGDMVKELLDRSKLRLADDPAVQERFVRLLCEFEPDGVFPYLESHDSYKVDACLKLCKDFGITDAEAYLLERTGDVTGALTLILHSLEQKLKILKPALRGYNLSAPSTSSTENGSNTTAATGKATSASSANAAAATSAMARGRGPSNESIIESVPEGREAKKTLEVALAMCQRNSMRNRDDQAEKLWFTLLDKLLRIQNAVKRSLTSKASSSSRLRAAPTVSSNVSASGAQTPFQVALNELIRIILERMASSVSLKSILFKITNEHGKGEFGDFRPTIFGMLDTYNYEQNIYQTANGLISADLFDQVVTLKRALSRAYAPPSEVCGYCKESLAKPPFGMAHSGATGGERWNLHSSMVMIVSRQVFHESCAKAWQQQDVGNSIAAALSASNGPGSTGSSGSRRLGSSQRHASVSSMTGSERGERSGSITSNDAGNVDDETSAKLQKKQPSTRRYLNRLKNARKTTRRPVALHIVLESLIREDTGRNKYLKSSRAMFSLRPDPEQTHRIKRRIGPRKPGSLPAEPIHKGHI
ncbi:hypothetical protein P43SY_004781 [Pythium insidiosum]|uniref:Vacuolar protein sorting-associated protein 8 central domain-containing protein n=1 Tax=Pythium insidiosum TaxID=114742 RepID=A0AAD5LRU7_PYTIN|nr:hypothetical protein P43SY_004781 [Pythium insidiosum]